MLAAQENLFNFSLAPAQQLPGTRAPGRYYTRETLSWGRVLVARHAMTAKGHLAASLRCKCLEWQNNHKTWAV